MRSSLISVAVICLLAVFLANDAEAVGLTAVGKEDCVCSPLVERGIVPDTLNKLKLAFEFPQLSMVLDRLALDVRGILGQFGVGPQALAVDSVPPKEEIKDLKEPKETKEFKKSPVPAKKSKLQAKQDQTKKETRKTKKLKSKKRVKVPPRAM